MPPKMGSFPREHTSGMSPALPSVKAPTAPPGIAMPDAAPAAIKGPKAPKMSGASVSVKKPKPPSSRLREQNGM